MHERLEKIKTHLTEHKEAYVVGSICIAGFTTLIVRGAALQHIGRGITVTANRGIPVVGKSVVIGSISYISANRKGPPSWVIRCIETNEITSSQNAMAKLMGLSAAELSRHLNGALDHVRGYHFERICLAA